MVYWGKLISIIKSHVLITVLEKELTQITPELEGIIISALHINE